MKKEMFLPSLACSGKNDSKVLVGRHGSNPLQPLVFSHREHENWTRKFLGSKSTGPGPAVAGSQGVCDAFKGSWIWGWFFLLNVSPVGCFQWNTVSLEVLGSRTQAFQPCPGRITRHWFFCFTYFFQKIKQLLSFSLTYLKRHRKKITVLKILLEKYWY